MPQSSSLAHKHNPTSGTGKRPRKPSSDNFVPMAIRVTSAQFSNLDELADKLMMHKADLVRKGLDLGIEWARERITKLGRKA